MAESNRRGEDAAAEHVDDVFDDAVDDDAQDDDETVSGGHGTATKARKVTDGKDARAIKSADKAEKVGFFGRIGRFVREVVAELRKVIWPTRNELLTYTAVVIVFLAAVMTYVGVLDLGLAKGVLFVFGDPK
ncbi:preprotein translocase subunit SecE [Catellatospora sp. NPDC049609]|uniref:preprotein translocase subunit SecE n=1 Tax=Catellatospora sp. NPDC049609 TaxID=3155505 RepID=UPI00342522BC